MATERNSEIWSTRLQRELLALTTDDAPKETKDEITTVLPPFVSVKDHKLDIEHGECVVSFLVDLPVPKTEEKAAEDLKEDAEKTEESEAGTEDTNKADESKEDTEKNGEEEEPAPIVITLQASLSKKADGSVDQASAAYPFLKPLAVLASGASRFPKGSTVTDDCLVDIEIDWTPSLHLTDAVLNVALKIKECLLQGEPYHAAPEDPKQAPVEDIMNRAKRIGTSFSKGLRGLAEKAATDKSDGEKPKKGIRLGRKKKKDKPKSPKATPGEVRIGDEINMLEDPWVDCQGVYSCKAIRRPGFVDDAMAVASQSTDGEQQVRSSSARREGDGDVPENITGFMKAQAGTISQAANAGMSGAGAMFRTFTQSARSVLEESFLMITESYIIEMRSNKLNLSTGIVTFAIPIDMLAKLKFRRQESISLFFKPAPDDPLIYMCPDSADCVHQIQSVLKKHGVKGKHTNAATHRAINQALHLVQEIQTKELALKHDPTVERVNEIMDLYRQAAERFEVAGDVRHEEVVTHMRKFLALPLTVSILDGSYKKPEGGTPISTTGEGGAVPEGEVLESGALAGDGGQAKGRANSEDRVFEENMDSILKEAEEDLANLQVEEDPELDAMLEETAGLGGDDGDDAIADFENMLKEADNELAELMNS